MNDPKPNERHDAWCACKECMAVKMRGRKGDDKDGLSKESIEKGS